MGGPEDRGNGLQNACHKVIDRVRRHLGPQVFVKMDEFPEKRGGEG